MKITDVSRYRLRFLPLSIAGLCWCVCSSSVVAGDPAPDKQAINAYNRGDDQIAIELLRKRVAEKPNDATAHYYLANALMKISSYDESKSEYKLALANSTDKSIREYCEQALKYLERKQESKQLERDQASKQPERDQASEHVERDQIGTPDEYIIGIPDEANLNAEDRAHIFIESKGKYADRTYQDVLWCLSKLPRKLKDALWSKDVKITLCTSMGDHARIHNWGAPGGNMRDWAQTFAGTGNGNVSIGETYDWGNHKNLESKRPGMVAMHELGHAFEQKIVVSTADKHQAYQLDNDTQPANRKFHKYLESEIFAELFRNSMCLWGGLPLKGTNAGLEQSWPNTWKYVQSCLLPYRD